MFFAFFIGNDDVGSSARLNMIGSDAVPNIDTVSSMMQLESLPEIHVLTIHLYQAVVIALAGLYLGDRTCHTRLEAHFILPIVEDNHRFEAKISDCRFVVLGLGRIRPTSER
ncbi:hypothetical protein DZC52_04050 [Wenzhouxiangella sediminis]|uniref:Uncharacterized protein n=1 Tax=Wenzhouxiangella sediminis TaxID=1792836 RepID=A0A3E1KAS1_9GAMM|nr:hypothetical protein DZC52_04050 [Wenzhouxiangella sediminis]